MQPDEVKAFVEGLRQQLFGERGQLNSMGLNLLDALKLAEVLTTISSTQKGIDNYVRDTFSKAAQREGSAPQDASDDVPVHGMG